MQYLLDEKEYQDLIQATKIEQLRVQQNMMDLCQRVCNHEPITLPTGEVKPPKGCIRSYTHIYFCDGCPVLGLCPYKSKVWSGIVRKESS